MTVIAGAVTADGVVIAADAQETTGGMKSIGAQKIWTTDQFVLAAAGNSRATQIVQYETDWPVMTRVQEATPEKFAVVSLVPAIGEALKKRDCKLEDINLLMALPGDHLLKICCGCVEVGARLAGGSGAAEALGFLGTRGPWAEKDVIEAVRRACSTDIYCSLPITVGNARDLRTRTVQD